MSRPETPQMDNCNSTDVTTKGLHIPAFFNIVNEFISHSLEVNHLPDTLPVSLHETECFVKAMHDAALAQVQEGKSSTDRDLLAAEGEAEPANSRLDELDAYGTALRSIVYLHNLTVSEIRETLHRVTGLVLMPVIDCDPAHLTRLDNVHAFYVDSLQPLEMAQNRYHNSHLLMQYPCCINTTPLTKTLVGGVAPMTSNANTLVANYMAVASSLEGEPGDFFKLFYSAMCYQIEKRHLLTRFGSLATSIPMPESLNTAIPSGTKPSDDGVSPDFATCQSVLPKSITHSANINFMTLRETLHPKIFQAMTVLIDKQVFSLNCKPLNEEQTEYLHGIAASLSAITNKSVYETLTDATAKSDAESLNPKSEQQPPEKPEITDVEIQSIRQTYRFQLHSALAEQLLKNRDLLESQLSPMVLEALNECPSSFTNDCQWAMNGTDCNALIDGLKMDSLSVQSHQCLIEQMDNWCNSKREELLTAGTNVECNAVHTGTDYVSKLKTCISQVVGVQLMAPKLSKCLSQHTPPPPPMSLPNKGTPNTGDSVPHNYYVKIEQLLQAHTLQNIQAIEKWIFCQLLFNIPVMKHILAECNLMYLRYRIILQKKQNIAFDDKEHDQVGWFLTLNDYFAMVSDHVNNSLKTKMSAATEANAPKLTDYGLEIINKLLGSFQRVREPNGWTAENWYSLHVGPEATSEYGATYLQEPTNVCIHEQHYQNAHIPAFTADMQDYLFKAPLESHMEQVGLNLSLGEAASPLSYDQMKSQGVILERSDGLEYIQLNHPYFLTVNLCSIMSLMGLSAELAEVFVSKFYGPLHDLQNDGNPIHEELAIHTFASITQHGELCIPVKNYTCYIGSVTHWLRETVRRKILDSDFNYVLCERSGEVTDDSDSVKYQAVDERMAQNALFAALTPANRHSNQQLNVLKAWFSIDHNWVNEYKSYLDNLLLQLNTWAAIETMGAETITFDDNPITISNAIALCISNVKTVLTRYMELTEIISATSDGNISSWNDLPLSHLVTRWCRMYSTRRVLPQAWTMPD